MNEAIKSTLTGGTNVFLEKQIKTETLIRKYWKKFEIDVSYLFKGVEAVSIYKCVDTGFRFYYPFTVAGDDKFYRQLGKFDWYYLPWKWEHEECVKYIKNNDAVLEVGAANGNFLKGLKQFRKVRAIGLELNSEAVEQGKEEEINLLNQSIEEHSAGKLNEYDVVCSFQVLEHIPNVKWVIEAMVACLKPGGKLIISVPNNDSFIKDNSLPTEILNMPPHHMGLWNEESMMSLCAMFPLEHMDTRIEPLQPAQIDTYQYIKVKRLLFNSNFLARVYWKFRLYLVLRPLLMKFSSHITGHTIMCVYTKK